MNNIGVGLRRLSKNRPKGAPQLFVIHYSIFNMYILQRYITTAAFLALCGAFSRNREYP